MRQGNYFCLLTIATTKIANAIISEIASYVDISHHLRIERVFPPFIRMVQLYPVTTYLVYFTKHINIYNNIIINIYDSSAGVNTLLNSLILLFA